MRCLDGFLWFFSMNSIASSNFNFHRSSCVIILHFTKRQHHQANHRHTHFKSPRAVAQNRNLPFGQRARAIGAANYMFILSTSSLPIRLICPSISGSFVSMCSYARLKRVSLGEGVKSSNKIGITVSLPNRMGGGTVTDSGYCRPERELYIPNESSLAAPFLQERCVLLIKSY